MTNNVIYQILESLDERITRLEQMFVENFQVPDEEEEKPKPKIAEKD